MHQGKLVVTFNWLSLFACLLAEFIYFRREAWLISHLDDNDAAPYNQLPTFIGDAEHAHLAAGLREHNKMARGTAVSVLLLCTFNLVFSCALLLTPPSRGGRFNGTRTLVGLVSNTLLLARRVVQNARISALSSREDLGLSLYQMKVRASVPPAERAQPRPRALRACGCAACAEARLRAAVPVVQRPGLQAQSQGGRGEGVRASAPHASHKERAGSRHAA